jgi:hypothetical protein
MTNDQARRVDRYAGDLLMRHQAASAAIKERRAKGSLSTQQINELSDQLREITGSVRTVFELTPRIEGEHRRSVQWALERLAAAARHVMNLPYVEAHERQAVDARLRALVGRLETGELDQAEAEARELDQFLEELATTGAAAEFDALMSTVDALYTPAQ